jgi:hypothetical protein
VPRDVAKLGLSRRTADLIVRRQGAETLVFDNRTETAHCLPPQTTRVWDACAPDHDLASLAAAAEVDEAVAASSLSQLSDLGLLEQTRTGLDRRRFLARTAAAGAGVAALPLVQSVLAPAVSAAASPPPTPCLAIFTQTGCSGNKVNYTVTFHNLAPNTTYFVVVRYKNTQVTDEFSITSDASGNATFSGTSGAAVPHTQDLSVNVAVYRDAAHTFLICDDPALPINGC